MPRKQDRILKRLAYWAKHRQDQSNRQMAMALVRGTTEPPLDFKRPEVRDLISKFALDHQLDVATDPPICDAFKMLHLNPRNPLHWVMLVYFLADAVFGKGSAGRLPIWDATRLRQLVEDVAKVRAEHQTFTDEKTCEYLAKKSEHYKGFEAETLQRRLIHARQFLTDAGELADKETPVH